METMSNLTSPPPPGIPGLDQPNDMAHHTLDDMLTQSMQTAINGGYAAPAFLIDPQSLPDDAEVHLLPLMEGNQTILYIDPDSIISIILNFGFIARFSPI